MWRLCALAFGYVHSDIPGLNWGGNHKARDRTYHIILKFWGIFL
jgi:hypothetical protein